MLKVRKTPISAGQLRTLKHDLMDDLFTGCVRFSALKRDDPGMATAEAQAKTIDGRARTVRELLDKAKYAIDFYQREYAWQERQVRELIDDLTGKFLDSYESGHSRHWRKSVLGVVLSFRNPGRPPPKTWSLSETRGGSLRRSGHLAMTATCE